MASQTSLEEKIVELENSKQIPQNSRTQIQRVAEYLKNRKDFEKHYSPKLVSIGPIHHGNTSNANLKLGEKYKLTWAAKYIENAGLNPCDLHKKIIDNIDELKGHFSDDVLTLAGKSLEGFGSLEEKLSWMLFVDGCSLLYILEKAKLDEPGHMNIKVDQLVLVMMDVLLLENQLPYVVLKLLWKDNNESELIKSMKMFLTRHPWATLESILELLTIISFSWEKLPTHLLDLQRNIILFTQSKSPKNLESHVRKMSYRSVQSLRAVGIRLKSTATRNPQSIEFAEGWFTAKLTLPEIVVDDRSAATILNLIAYEMCPDFENDYGICSFATFMDSLIDHPEDVKLLRSKGILLNSPWSDEEVANLFNSIRTNFIPDTEIYFKVRAKIDEHYCNRWKTWIGQGLNTYFSNPWAFIAFVAAFIALALTLIQTWFTVQPASK
ncbi:DUF247 domain protein [Medicago truncatula]|nr:DUF247 domain protein [Medicago truncatula]